MVNAALYGYMVGIDTGHRRSTTPAAIVESHRENSRRNTAGEWSDDELDGRALSSTKLGLWTPRTRYKLPGLVGWFDMGEMVNELTTTRSAALPRSRATDVYHQCEELIVGDLPRRIQTYPSLPDGARLPTWRDYFRGGRWTGLSFADRLPASNWEDYNNTYYSQPDFAEARAEERDPESVAESQSGLDAFAGDVSACVDGVRSCSCCECPAGHKGIRHRSSKSPAYKCNSPNCDWEGEEPVVHPARRDD